MKFRNIRAVEFLWLIISVVTMGLCLSFLNKVSFGTDPCTTFNLGMARLLNMSLGNWQSLFNSFLFIFVFLFAREQIGWGTLANMFLVGYSFDFFTWVIDTLLPADFFQPMYLRVIIAVPALALFILAAAIYISIQQGTAPYDAMSFLLSKKLPNIPFKITRMIWDISVCILGVLLGEKIGVVTVIMAFAFGPVIAYTREHIVTKLIPQNS